MSDPIDSHGPPPEAALSMGKQPTGADAEEQSSTDHMDTSKEKESGLFDDNLKGVPFARPANISRGRLPLLLFSLVVLLFYLSQSHQYNYFRRKPLVIQCRGCPGPSIDLEISRQLTNFSLDLPFLYPDITSPPNSECWNQWHSFTPFPCHGKLLDRSNDNGTLRGQGGDPTYLTPLICDAKCEPTLNLAYELLRSKCSRDEDRFNIEGYKGIFSTTLLEPGPLAAVEVLLRRSRHICRKSPIGDSDYGYCPIEMMDRFFVVDGMNPGYLSNIGRFMSRTSRKRIEPARRKSSIGGNIHNGESHSYLVREQRYGPGIGDTTCGWCALDYLNRTLNSWTQHGEILNPNSKLPVSLPEFVHRVKAAGQRCEPEKWNQIYENAIERYQAAGLLPSDWGRESPLEDILSIIENGPSEIDEPVSTIYSTIERLPATSTDPNDRSILFPEESKVAQKCLQSLAHHYTSMPCFINLNHTFLFDMLKDRRRTYEIRSTLCSKRCISAIESQGFMHSCTPALSIPIVSTFLKQLWSAEKEVTSYCALPNDEFPSSSCSRALSSLGHTDWLSNGRPPTSQFVEEVSKALDILEEKPIPQVIRPALQKSVCTLPTAACKLPDRWIQELKEGVCSKCVWTWLTGANLADSLQYLVEADSTETYLGFVKRYYDTCSERGATWLGGFPYGHDPLIWRVKNPYGQVYRYKASNLMGEPIIGLDEATRSMGVANDANSWGSYWHLLFAERLVKAIKDGNVEKSLQDEISHREKEDAKAWKVFECIKNIQVKTRLAASVHAIPANRVHDSVHWKIQILRGALY